MPRVLLVGNGSERKRLKTIFQSVKVPCDSVDDFEDVYMQLEKDPPALIVAQNPGSLEPIANLKSLLREKSPATPFLITIKKPDLETAMAVMQAGAFDCLSAPYEKIEVLSAAKRATSRAGRMLFVAKLRRKKTHPVLYTMALLVFLGLFQIYLTLRMGPPPDVINLASANLSGLAWEGRTLWAGDWLESTITAYESKPGLLPGSRALVMKQLFHLEEGQPILICNTPDFLATVSSDLKMRIHRRSLGLPAFQTAPTPGLNPTGLVWDGSNLWSADGQSGLLYKHSEDLKVVETVRSIIPAISGLASDGQAFWVMGGMPLKLSRLEIKPGGTVWSEPVEVKNLLMPGVAPTGMAVGFGRIWVVSGGDPKMVSIAIPELGKK